MPVNKNDFPDREFWSRQIHFTAKDCEILFWLVMESGLDESTKERLSNKLQGYFLSPATQARSAKLLKTRAKRVLL